MGAPSGQNPCTGGDNVPTIRELQHQISSLCNALPAKPDLKVSYGLDLPVLLVSLFDRHNFVNPYHVGIGVVKQGIFQRYVHAPTGFAGMEFLDIPCRIRMMSEPVDMFAYHPAIFLREFADELFYTGFNFDLHKNSV